MSTISEMPRLPLRSATPAVADYKPTKAGAEAVQPQSVATAPASEERLAAHEQAHEQAHELTRSQAVEQRLKRNRFEEGPSPSGPGSPEVELTFGDFIDLINPLQHIPIISTIYRAITGDDIGGTAKILGGMLFGGPIGFIAAAFDTILTQATGRSLGEAVVAAFTDSDAAPAVQVASAPARQNPDIQSLAAPDTSIQGAAPEDSPATATGAPGPIISHKDPFGLQRESTATIVATPGALVPIAVTSAALPPNLQAAAIPHTGPKPAATQAIADPAPIPDRPALGGIPRVPAAPGLGALPVPIIVTPASADASRPRPQRLIPSFGATDRGFTERMLEALDKYQAQASERLRGNNRASRRLDLEL